MSERILIVDSSRQTAELWETGRRLKTFTVSTAAKGLGCESGSLRTPPGRLKVEKKIGHGLPAGAVLRARTPTHETWTPDGPPSSEDLVLTRILWLSGLEPRNANTLERYIYLHGTNQEALLGTPASHGCIRFSSRDIVEVFDLLREGDVVEIT